MKKQLWFYPVVAALCCIFNVSYAQDRVIIDLTNRTSYQFDVTNHMYYNHVKNLANPLNPGQQNTFSIYGSNSGAPEGGILQYFCASSADPACSQSPNPPFMIAIEFKNDGSLNNLHCEATSSQYSCSMHEVSHLHYQMIFLYKYNKR